MTKTNLVHAFAGLLKDPEAEVRAAACARLKGENGLLVILLGGVVFILFIDFCDNLDEDYRVDSILTQIMPCIQVRWTLLSELQVWK